MAIKAYNEMTSEDFIELGEFYAEQIHGASSRKEANMNIRFYNAHAQYYDRKVFGLYPSCLMEQGYIRRMFQLKRGEK